MQHGVRIEAVFASLQQRRTYSRIHAISLHTSSHPDKYNNSVNRIISKEKEREDIQGEILQRPHFNSNPRVSSEDPKRDSSFYMQSSILQINSIYRINSTRNTRFILCRLTPAVAPCVSKHSTRQNQVSKHPTVLQALTAQAGFQ